MNLRNIAVYLQESTVHGIRYWVDGENRFHKICWVFIVFTSAAYCAYLVSEGMRDWEENPTSSTIEKVAIKEMSFPAVTICPETKTPWLAYQHILNQIELDTNLKSLIPTTYNMAIKRLVDADSYLDLKTNDDYLKYSPTAEQDYYLEVYAKYYGALPTYDMSEQEMRSYFANQMDEWQYRVDRYYKESCEKGTEFCSFYETMMYFYIDVSQETGFAGWKMQNSVHKNGKKIEPDVVEFGRVYTKKFINEVDITNFQSKIMEEYTKHLQAKDFSEVSGWSEPKGPPPPPDSDYSYDYNYYSSNYCEVKEVSLGAEDDRENIYHDYANALINWTEKMVDFLENIEIMCPGWNDEYLGSMLKNFYDSRSFIKNAKAIKYDFHRSIIDPERLEKDFEYLKSSSMIDSVDSCHGDHRPVNTEWKERELKLVKIMRENFQVLAYPDGLNYPVWNNPNEMTGSGTGSGSGTGTGGGPAVSGTGGGGTGAGPGTGGGSGGAEGSGTGTEGGSGGAEGSGSGTGGSSGGAEGSGSGSGGGGRRRKRQSDYYGTGSGSGSGVSRGSCEKDILDSNYCNYYEVVSMPGVDNYNTPRCLCACEKKIKLDIYAIYNILKDFEKATINRTGDLLTWYYKWEQDHFLSAAEANEEPERLDDNEDLFYYWKFLYDKDFYDAISDEGKKLYKEYKDFNIFLMNNTLDTGIDVGLDDFIYTMSMPGYSVEEITGHTRMKTFPLEARKEIFALFNYSYLYPFTDAFKSQVVPNFEDIQGKPLASICSDGDPAFENYCELEKKIPSLEKFFQILKLSAHPENFNHDTIKFNMGDLESSSKNTTSHLTLVPICWWGEESALYLNSEEIPTELATVVGEIEGSKNEYLSLFKVPAGDIYRYPKCNFFTTTPTDLGMCQTFNAKPLEQVLKPSSWLNLFNYEFLTKDFIKAKNVAGIGKSKGFVFVVDLMTSNGISKHSHAKNNFWMKIHDPSDVPMLTNEDLSSWTKVHGPTSGSSTTMEMTIYGEKIGSDESFQTLDFEARQCYFSHEGNLQMFSYYTENNCKLDCLWKKATEVCGCKPWNIPQIDGDKTCFYLGNICFYNIVKKYNANEMEGLGCNCLPGCEEHTYTLFTHKTMREQLMNYCKYYNMPCDGHLSDFSKYTTMTRNDGGTVALSGWFNLADYILDPEQIIYPQDPLVLSTEDMRTEFFCDKVQNHVCESEKDYVGSNINKRVASLFTISMSFPQSEKKVSVITKSSRMKFSDKISWVGGNLGLFTGFSLISGFEMLYWLLFKILFHKRDQQVAPEEETTCKKCGAQMEEMKTRLLAMEQRIGMVKGGDESSKMAFDALFQSPEDAVPPDVEVEVEVE